MPTRLSHPQGAVAEQRVWLTFFGKPGLIRGGRHTPLAMRYRKSTALLAFLAAQSGRPVRRELLAELLWPGRPLEEGRRNLRVIINDLNKQLPPLGLPARLECGRQWLTLHGEAALVTDEQLVQGLAEGQDWALQTAPQRDFLSQVAWGEALELEEANPDWQDWLQSRQAYLHRLCEQFPAALPTPTTPPLAAEPCPEVAQLALLRLEAGIPAGRGIDERAHHAQWIRTVAEVAEEVALFGGSVVDHDASGITVAFGLSTLNCGFRWQALRTAAELACRFGDIDGLRIVLSAGTNIVEFRNGTAPRISGWRLKWVECLSLLIAPGEIIADGGFADLAPMFGLAPWELPLPPLAYPAQAMFGQQLAHFHLPTLPPPGSPLPLVGREAELQLLEQRWQDSRQAMGQRLAISAQQGMGKTRLAWEFARQRIGQGGMVSWFGARAETAQQPWSLLYEWLTRRQRQEDIPQRLNRKEQLLLQQFLEQRSVPTPARGDFERLVARLLEGAELIVIDDAHWADNASAQLLQRVLPHFRGGLILITQRNSGQPSVLLGDSTVINLRPLTDQAARDLLTQAPHGLEYSGTALRSALHQARGVPIYLVTASGNAADSPAHHEFQASIINAARPALLNLGAAALLGMQWRYSDLCAMVGDSGALQATVVGCDASLLLNYDAEHWVFYHPLVQETLLATLPEEERQRLTRAAAERFTSLDQPGRAAPLWEQAGELDQARSLWREAARRAVADEDMVAACDHYGQLQRLGYDTSTLALWDRIRYARAWVMRDGYGTEFVREQCQTVLALLPPQLTPEQSEIEFSALVLLYLWSGGIGKSTGLDYAERLRQRANAPERQFAADWAFGNTYFWLGDFPQARRHLEAVLEQRRHLSPQQRIRYFPSDPCVFATASLAWIDALTGAAGWPAALHLSIEAQREKGIRLDLCVALTLGAAASLEAGEYTASAAYAREALELASAENFTFWEVFAGLLATVHTARAGKPPLLAQLEGWEQAIAYVYPAGTNSARWLMSEALVASGQWEAAGSVIRRALQAADDCEHSYCLPDLWRLKAAVCRATGQRERVAPALENAERLARQMGARGWLARWREELAAAALAPCLP